MKHAFLIMAHKNMNQLAQLIKTIDNKDADVYVHLDKKIANPDFELIKGAVKQSKIYFVKRINGFWGGYSLIRIEKELFTSAHKRGYRYYHLMSGDSMLLENVRDFIDYMNKSYPTQFVEFVGDGSNKDFSSRVRYYYPTDLLNNRKIISFLNYSIIPIVGRLGLVNRLKNISIPLKKGSQWVSITDDAVEFLINESNDNLSTKMFRNGFLVDELYVQTILSLNREFQFADYQWEIDWTKGKPYTFQLEDIPYLKSSGKLFARKVSMELLKHYHKEDTRS